MSGSGTIELVSATPPITTLSSPRTSMHVTGAATIPHGSKLTVPDVLPVAVFERTETEKGAVAPVVVVKIVPAPDTTTFPARAIAGNASTMSAASKNEVTVRRAPTDISSISHSFSERFTRRQIGGPDPG